MAAQTDKYLLVRLICRFTLMHYRDSFMCILLVVSAETSEHADDTDTPRSGTVW
jgi:hypothetical protein